MESSESFQGGVVVKFSHIIPTIAMVAILSGCGNSTRSTDPVSAGDTTPPPAVTGIGVLVHGATGDATLIWEPSTAPDVARYEVSVADGGSYAIIGSTPSTRMKVPSVSAGETFAVRAIDGTGNVGPYGLHTVGEGDVEL
jgi:hypothetical protein